MPDAPVDVKAALDPLPGAEYEFRTIDLDLDGIEDFIVKGPALAHTDLACGVHASQYTVFWRRPDSTRIILENCFSRMSIRAERIRGFRTIFAFYYLAGLDFADRYPCVALTWYRGKYARSLSVPRDEVERFLKQDGAWF